MSCAGEARRTILSSLSAAMSLVLAAACTTSTAEKLCVPGASVACVGTGGCSGGQVCAPDGLSYGACDCGAPSDGGAQPDAGFTQPMDRGFVVSSWDLPITAGAAEAVGMDVDPIPDGRVDNQLGQALAALDFLQGPLVEGLRQDVATGAFILLLNVRTETPPDARALLSFSSGAGPVPAACESTEDTLCGKHLQGNASFTATPAGDDHTLGAALASNLLSAGPGRLDLPFRLNGVPLVLPAQRALTSVRLEGTTLTQGRVAGALPMEYVRQTLFPALMAPVPSIVQRDCTGGSPPECGCAADSQGKQLLTQLEQPPADCTLSDEELRSAFDFVQPDVDVDGDGTAEMLSFGFGVTGVGGQFTPP